MQKFNWSDIELVVFDIDGTLYNQAGVRLAMFWKLLGHYLLHSGEFKDIQILAKFRKVRDNLQPGNVEENQYSVVAQALGVSPERVKKVVQKWILTEPLNILSRYVYKGVREFVQRLEERGKKVVFLSDYPAEEKLRALGIPFDPKYVYYTADSEIDALKPDPKGLLLILDACNVDAERTLLIGDRDEKEGETARAVGAQYLIVNTTDPGYEWLTKTV